VQQSKYLIKDELPSLSHANPIVSGPLRRVNSNYNEDLLTAHINDKIRDHYKRLEQLDSISGTTGAATGKNTF